MSKKGMKFPPCSLSLHPAPVSEVVRAALAHLPDAYHLEEE
jgi:hypothetical protein